MGCYVEFIDGEERFNLQCKYNHYNVSIEHWLVCDELDLNCEFLPYLIRGALV
jgi:hypothetical protein